MSQLEENANLSRKILSTIPGVKAIYPQGAMYLMLQLDLSEFKGFNSDMDFVQALVKEESVLSLPGSCFRCPSPFVRIVFSNPRDKLEVAFGRIREFCQRHHIKSC